MENPGQVTVKGFWGFVRWLFERFAAWRKRRHKTTVRKRYRKLTRQQQEFLRTVYVRGKRSFEIGSGQEIRMERWFEELIEWNYIKSHRQIVIIPAPEAYHYSVTVPGWKQIEKNWSRPLGH